MKIKILLVFLFFSHVLFAQSNDPNKEHENFFRIGAKGGVNVNKVNGQSFKKGFRYNFQAGIFTQFNFSDRFGIQPEVNFVQASSELSNNTEEIYDDLFGGGSQNKAKLSYLEIPLLLNINIGPSKKVKLQVGPSYGTLLKQKVDSLKQDVSIYKKNEWSLVGGFWLQLPVINLGVRYKQGLTNINAVDNKQSWKNQAIQVFLGFTI